MIYCNSERHTRMMSPFYYYIIIILININSTVKLQHTLPGQKSCTSKIFNYIKLHIIITFQILTVYTLTNEITMYNQYLVGQPLLVITASILLGILIKLII